MGRQAGLFDVEERLRELSAKGDDLERISGLVDFEAFRPELERAVPRSDRARGGRDASKNRCALDGSVIHSALGRSEGE